MDILVLLDEPGHPYPAGVAAGAPAALAHHTAASATGELPWAHVQRVPDAGSPGFGGAFDAAPRDVVTLYGPVEPGRVAFALAAAVSALGDAAPSDATPSDATRNERPGEGSAADGPIPASAVRHLAVWPEAGAVGDAAWRERGTGRLRSRDVTIPAEQLHAVATALLADCGPAIRQLAAGLQMPDWPEGVRRALRITLPAAGDGCPEVALAAGVGGGEDALLASLREADGYDDAE